ncbi:MAG: hypothetical protein QW491_13605 [Thermoproteota archaeon]|nr:hypothetical protein [Candidatus Brockarchaeota archaeon]
MANEDARGPTLKTVEVQPAHPLVVDPIFEELERILLIMQNEDGSWGSAETLDDRLYTTGWAIRALASQNIVSPLNKTAELVRGKVVPQLEEQFKPLIWTHIRKLCGLFLLLPLIYEKELWNNPSLFNANLKQLLDFIKKKDWLNEMVAGYFAFSCSHIKQLEAYVEDAKQYLSGLDSPEPKDVYRFIGNPNMIREYLKKSEFIEKLNSQINSLTDEQLAHLLLALSAIQRCNEPNLLNVLSNVKQKLIEHIQTRQLSDLDKKVTKEFLDLLLLLRVNIPLDELQTRLKRLNNEVFIKDVQHTDNRIRLSTEIPSHKLQETLGKIDIPTISCYILSNDNLGIKNVYLVPKQDYEKVQSYFVTQSYCVPSKRLFAYEIALSLPILAGMVYFLSILYPFLSSQVPVSVPVPEWTKPIFIVLIVFVVNAAILIGLLTVATRLLRFLFPEIITALISALPNTIRRSKIAKTIVGE